MASLLSSWQRTLSLSLEAWHCHGSCCTIRSSSPIVIARLAKRAEAEFQLRRCWPSPERYTLFTELDRSVRCSNCDFVHDVSLVAVYRNTLFTDRVGGRGNLIYVKMFMFINKISILPRCLSKWKKKKRNLLERKNIIIIHDLYIIYTKDISYRILFIRFLKKKNNNSSSKKKTRFVKKTLEAGQAPKLAYFSGRIANSVTR